MAILIYSNAAGVVLDKEGERFLIPYTELRGVHDALATVECSEGNVYTSPCRCVRHGANRATRMAATRP